jgi:hypothetical protein
MARPIPWFWLLLALLLLLPGPAGRFLLDLLGGLTLTILLLPLLAGGVAVVGWQILKRRLRTCSSCGATSLGQPVCPACGTLFDTGQNGEGETGGSDAPGSAWGWVNSAPEIDPRNVTINVEAVDVESKPGDSSRPG